MSEELSFKERVKNYCKKRKQVTKNQDLIYLGEVNNLCPKCGHPLVYIGDRRVSKNYEIAHIFPCNPTDDDMLQLDGVELYGADAESMDNKIALCKFCHNDYDNNKTREKYEYYLNLKKRIQTQFNVKSEISNYIVEKELKETICRLSNLVPSELEDVELDYIPKTVSEKVEDAFFILRNEIENNVRLYFGFIHRQILLLCQESGKDMNAVSLSIKSSYYKCKQKGLDKNSTFATLSEWVCSKTNCDETSAKIIISYFVQTCDVYEKLSK